MHDVLIDAIHDYCTTTAATDQRLSRRRRRRRRREEEERGGILIEAGILTGDVSPRRMMRMRRRI